MKSKERVRGSGDKILILLKGTMWTTQTHKLLKESKAEKRVRGTAQKVEEEPLPKGNNSYTRKPQFYGV